MLHLRSFNRFILISLALLGLSVSSVNAATLLYDESVSGDTDAWSGSPQDIGSVVSGDYVLGTEDFPDWDGWMFTLDGSIDEIVFEVLGGTINNGWQLYDSPYDGGNVGVNKDSLATTHTWDIAGLTGAYILGNNSVGGNSDYSYKISFASAVPVPAAVWLFGTALIGFVGMSRRRKVA